MVDCALGSVGVKDLESQPKGVQVLLNPFQRIGRGPGEYAAGLVVAFDAVPYEIVRGVVAKLQPDVRDDPVQIDKALRQLLRPGCTG
jgi:hypothetical protein